MTQLLKETGNTEAVKMILDGFGENVGMDVESIFEQKLTLKDVVEKSEILHNSVDLLETFAKLAYKLKKQFNAKVKLPSYPMDTEVLIVMNSFIEEFDKAYGEEK